MASAQDERPDDGRIGACAHAVMTLLPPVRPAASQEPSHRRVRALVAQRFRRSRRRSWCGSRASRKMALSPMAKMLASSCVTTTMVAPEAVAQLEDQVVEQARADRIEPGRRLVEEEDVGIERHGARQAGALLHAAADLGGIEVLEALEADQRQLERRRSRGSRAAGSSVNSAAAGRRSPPGSSSSTARRSGKHAEARAAGRSRPRARPPVSSRRRRALARAGLVEADHVPEQRALAAAAAAHDDEDLAAPTVKSRSRWITKSPYAIVRSLT